MASAWAWAAAMGAGASEVRLAAPAKVHVTANVAALLNDVPDESVRNRPYDQKPYWELERARIGGSHKVPLELIVNGQPVARQEIEADGVERPLTFDYHIDRSSWVALRILPSSHTNPIFVLVNDKPIRASQKSSHIRLEERGEAQRAYDAARDAYRQRLNESTPAN